MPIATRIFIFFGFFFLIVGVALWGLSWKYAFLFPLSLHFITLGWITNLIFGVAFWMFPKPWRKYRSPYITLALFNAGNFLRISEVFISKSPTKILFILSVILQFISCIIFAFHIWNRIGEGGKK